MNSKYVEIFKELAKFRRKEAHAAKALGNAADIIDSLEFKIKKSTIDDLKSIKGIGKGSFDRIKEILKTGTLAELEKFREKESNKFDFTTVVGFGEAGAEKMEDLGYSSIKEVLKANKKGDLSLTDLQLFGLKHYEDLKIRIPRDEVERIGGYVRTIAQKIDQNSIVSISGSYRRGAETSGDIDILLSHLESKNILEKLVKKLKKKDLIQNVLSLGDVKFMGSYWSDFSLRLRQGDEDIKERESSIKEDEKEIPLPEAGADSSEADPIMRKIDIRFIPYETYAAALMHSTGSFKFNIKMRDLANEKGLKLSEYGLMDKKTKKVLVTKTEQEIFDILGIDFVPPEKRE